MYYFLKDSTSKSKAIEMMQKASENYEKQNGNRIEPACNRKKCAEFEDNVQYVHRRTQKRVDNVRRRARSGFE